MAANGSEVSAHTKPRRGRVRWADVSGGLLCVMALLTIGLMACEGAPSASVPKPAPTGAPIRVVATIPPLRGLIAPLLTDAKIPHEFTTLVPPGASEHGFEISPDKLMALGKADIVVMAGLGMEPQVDKFLADHPNAGRRVVNLASVLKLEGDGHHDHDEDAHDDHDHHHHGADPHVWLDPLLVREAMVECGGAIREKAGAAVEAKLLDTVVQHEFLKVEAVHRAYEAALAAAPRRTIVVAHDAYSHLAKRYNLEVIAITGLNAGEPRPDDLKRAADAVREHHLTTIFVEPQLSPAAAERLAAATGAKTAVLDPLGDGDWYKLMNANLAALKEALGVNTADPADNGSSGIPAAKPPENPS